MLERSLEFNRLSETVEAREKRMKAIEDTLAEDRNRLELQREELAHGLASYRSDVSSLKEQQDVFKRYSTALNHSILDRKIRSTRKLLNLNAVAGILAGSKRTLCERLLNVRLRSKLLNLAYKRKKE